MIATAELVVPRSIPITEPLTFSSVDWKRAKAGLADLRRRPEERVALGSCEDKILVVSYRNRASDAKSKDEGVGEGMWRR